ncbi:MAG: hypothetical protein MK076_03215 [Flavobacteriales bacterium]|nr:hypothetical protein [Flavobacteriales bacterium]
MNLFIANKKGNQDIYAFVFANDCAQAKSKAVNKLDAFFDGIEYSDIVAIECDLSDSKHIRDCFRLNYFFYREHLQGKRKLNKRQLSVLRYFGDLLTIDQNAKTVKGQKQGYMTGISYMLPSDHLTKETVCPISDNCKNDCLAFAGRLKFTQLQFTLLAKKIFFLDCFEGWKELLNDNVIKLKTKAEKANLIPVARINGTSDISPKHFEDIIKKHPEVQFYDYTKYINNYKRRLLGYVDNYHITYSFDGSIKGFENMTQALNEGINVTVVFADKLPETWNGYKVINGDETDLRFLDEKPVIVGLKFKGNINKLNCKDFVVFG